MCVKNILTASMEKAMMTVVNICRITAESK